MSDEIAIQVRGLGKKYTIGGPQEKYHTVRDAIANSVKKPFQWMNRQGASQSTNEFWALKDVSFDVQEGEVVGIIGRNGAGKSTLLKILSQITTPTEGEVDIYGRVGSLLEVGTGFHPELTGRENIFLSGSILGMRKREIDEKFDEIVKFAEIEKFLDTPVKRYSSGMYVRLAFAVAAHMDTEILLVDEVLAVGDAAFQKKCMGKMGDVAKGGRTVLFVSHNMAMIKALCNRSILLQKGIIINDGETSSVIQSYLTQNNCDKIVDTTKLIRTVENQRSIKSVWCETSDGIISNEFLMGQSLWICFKFSHINPIINPGYGFGIDDIFGRRVVSLNNYLLSEKIFEKKNSGIACCYIPELPLTSGIYSISIAITENEITIIDYIENAYKIHIIPYDVFGTGKIPDNQQGAVFLKGIIEIRNDFGC